MESRKKVRDGEGAKSLSPTKAGVWVCCHGNFARVKVCGEETTNRECSSKWGGSEGPDYEVNRPLFSHWHHRALRYSQGHLEYETRARWTTTSMIKNKVLLWFTVFTEGYCGSNSRSSMIYWTLVRSGHKYCGSQRTYKTHRRSCLKERGKSASR